MNSTEIINALRTTKSRSKRALLDAAADLIENQQRQIDAQMYANESVHRHCEMVCAENKTINLQYRWIPVSEQLPKPEDEYGWIDCIVTVIESKWPRSSYDVVDAPESRELILPAKFDCFQKIWHVAECAVNALIDIEDAPLNGWAVTHWMHLPEPPKED